MAGVAQDLRDTVTTQVRATITNPDVRADFDIDAISDELLTTYGPDVDVSAIPDDQYWTVVARHDRTTGPTPPPRPGGPPPFRQPPDDLVRPSVAPLWIWWFLFSPVALIWAPIRANEAGRLGYTTGRYWAVFWAALIPIAAASR